MANYVSSYIPTLGASVTRSADAASKTGISSLIGQQEGVLYVEIDISILNKFVNIAYIRDTLSIYIGLVQNSNGSISAATAGTAPNVTITSPILSLGRHKLAIGYKAGDIAFYVDGAQIGVSSTATVIGPYSNLDVGIFGTFTQFDDRIATTALYTTRLSNSELASLTSL